MERIVASANLTLGELALYFGHHDTPEEFEAANQRGIELLQNLDILPFREQPKTCPRCAAEMSTITDRARGLGWRYRCNGPARHRMDPTVNTFMEAARMKEIGAFRIVMLIYCWLIGVPVTAAELQVQVGAETAMAWYKYCRDVATKIAWHDLRPLGGPGDVVEIDETHLFKRKYHVGRRTMYDHHWMFGAISRATKQRFGVMVESRDADTLTEIAQNFIDHQSYICSDQWRAYGHFNYLFAGHGTVNHSENFVQPPLGEDPIWVPTRTFLPECIAKNWIGPPPQDNVEPFRIHTNHAERSWRELKEILKKANGMQLVDGYIGEWMYRKNLLDNCENLTEKFFKFCTDAGRAYPGVGLNPMNINLEDCNCHECEE